MEHFNFTDFSAPDITKGCFDWCKETQFAHYNNLFINDMGLLFVACVLVFMNRFLNYHHHRIKLRTSINEDVLILLEKLSYYLIYVAILGFIINVVFFR